MRCVVIRALMSASFIFLSFFASISYKLTSFSLSCFFDMAASDRVTSSAFTRHPGRLRLHLRCTARGNPY